MTFAKLVREMPRKTRRNRVTRRGKAELHDARSGFDLVITLTREPSRRAGDYSRRVDTPMMSAVLTRLRTPPRQVFVCGSNPFVEAASQALIASSVPSGVIRTERYGG